MSPMKNVNSGNKPWTTDHDRTLARAIIQHLLSSRPALYTTPGLMGEVDGHGGNRISQKVITHCEKIAENVGLGKGVVKDIIAQMRGRKRSAENQDDEGSTRSKGIRKKVKTE